MNILENIPHFQIYTATIWVKEWENFEQIDISEEDAAQD